MNKKSTYKGITKRTKSLLENGENEIVDYKRNVKGIKSEDLVAFANSEDGGVLLIGVDEETINNVQKGKITGCNTDDNSKLVIMNKALGTSPPISLKIYTENIDKNPIFRIEIPTGEQKPYCTESGTYKIRKDGKNQGLKPEALLNLFLKKESQKFSVRFKEATDEIVTTIQSLGSTVDWMESNIVSKVEQMASSIGWAEYETTNAKNTIEDVESYVKRISKNLTDTNKRIKAIIEHQKIDDPLRLDFMNKLANELLPKIQEDDKLFERAKKGVLSFTTENSEFELTKEEIQTIIKTCVKHIESKSEEE